MSYIGKNPSVDELTIAAQSADPTNPVEGQIFNSDGTSRAAGLWQYTSGAWIKVNRPEITRYINEDFETGVANLVAYADAAGTTPVDATGGSPTLAVSAETSSPLIGSTSAKLTKTASNLQGEGVAIVSETIDEAYQDSVHTVEFLWKPDATFVADEVKLFVYHPTTALVEALYFRTSLSEYTNSLPSDSTRVHRIVTEIAPRDTTYQVVAHIAGTSSTAWTALIDNIQSGPARVVNVPYVTEWESYTPTWIGGSPAIGNGNLSAKWRRVGDSLEGTIYLYAGSTTTFGSGQWEFSLPAGLSINSDKLASGIDNTEALGFGYANDASGTVSVASVWPNVVGNTVYVIDSDGGTGSWRSTIPMSWSTNDYAALKFSVPISGWDAGATMGTTQVDTQTQIGRLVWSGGSQAIASTALTKVQINSSYIDTHGLVDTGNYRITAAKTGKYRIYALIYVNNSDTAAFDIYVYKNNVTLLLRNLNKDGGDERTITVSGIVELDAGDYIELFIQSGTDTSYSVGAGNLGALDLQAIPDFTTIGALSPATRLSPVTTKTTTYTATVADEIILCNSSSGAFTVTLPTAVANTGKQFVIKKIGTDYNNITVDGSGSETIDGATTYLLHLPKESVKIVSDGSNWQIADEKWEFEGCHASLTSNLNNIVTSTTIAFDTATYNPHSSYSTGTGLITIKAPGKYRISFSALFENFDSTDAYCTVVVNGSSKIQAYSTRLGVTTTAAVSTGAIIWDCIEGDTIGIFAVADADFNLSGSGRAWMSVNRISK